MSSGLSFLATLRAASEERPMPALGLARAANAAAVLWLAAIAAAGLAASLPGVPALPEPLAALVPGAAFACAIAIVLPALALACGAAIAPLVARMGWLHAIVGRPLESLTVVPGVALVALILAVGGTSMTALLVALFVALLPSVIRHMRLAAIDLHDEPWMEEARAMGVPRSTILRRHVLPTLATEARGLAPRLAIRVLLIEAVLSAALSSVMGNSSAWLDAGWPGASWGASWGAMMARAPDPAAMMAPALALTLTLLALSRLALVARRHQRAAARRRLGAIWTGLLP
jgi:peptide/nickel transport system permease protein